MWLWTTFTILSILTDVSKWSGQYQMIQFVLQVCPICLDGRGVSARKIKTIYVNSSVQPLRGLKASSENCELCKFACLHRARRAVCVLLYYLGDLHCCLQAMSEPEKRICMSIIPTGRCLVEHTVNITAAAIIRVVCLYIEIMHCQYWEQVIGVKTGSSVVNIYNGMDKHKLFLNVPLKQCSKCSRISIEMKLGYMNPAVTPPILTTTWTS